MKAPHIQCWIAARPRQCSTLQYHTAKKTFFSVCVLGGEGIVEFQTLHFSSQDFYVGGQLGEQASHQQLACLQESSMSKTQPVSTLCGISIVVSQRHLLAKTLIPHNTHKSYSGTAILLASETWSLSAQQAACQAWEGILSLYVSHGWLGGRGVLT